MNAVVVFLGEELVDNPAWYTRWLKPGFIHCLVLVESKGQWIKIEGQNGMVCIALAGSFNNVAKHYSNQGATVVVTNVDVNLMFPLVERTCVGLTKAVLGIRSWALTPWQLYQHLTRCV